VVYPRKNEDPFIALSYWLDADKSHFVNKKKTSMDYFFSGSK
jgi:hypothetical protein